MRALEKYIPVFDTLNSIHLSFKMLSTDDILILKN